MRIGVLGAGYVGRALTLELVGSGYEVVVVGRTEAPLAALVAEAGPAARFAVADTADRATLQAALASIDRVVHLAPPPRAGPAEDDAARVSASVPRGCDRIVYGSTTGVFVVPEDPAVWVDEDWPAGPRGQLGRRRLAYETALAETSPAPVHVVRIAGIYGPGRTLASKLASGELVCVEDGRPTSRIHLDDLARLLTAVVTGSAPPPRVVATDEAPAPTLEVARYTAQLLGLSPPPVMSLEEAEQQMSPVARELRSGGKRCRSLHRASLIGSLRYPTYREGVRASLVAEGRLADRESPGG